MITWLASYPKSGNTWLRCILSAYHNGQLDINDIRESYLDYQPHFYRSLLIDKSEPIDVMHVRTAALYHMDKHYINPTLKTHWGNYTVFGINAIPPSLTTKAIVMIRDPRDLVISLANFYNMNIDNVIEILNNPNAGTFEDDRYYFLGTWSQYIKSWQAATYKVLFLKYENMLTDTASNVERVLEYLELPIKNIDKCVELTQFERLKAQENDNGFVERKNNATFFYKGKSTWKDILTPEQVKKITDAHGEVMSEFGYEILS